MHDQRGVHVDLGDFLDHQIDIDKRGTITAIFLGDGHAKIVQIGQAFVVFLGIRAFCIPAPGSFLEHFLCQFAGRILKCDLLRCQVIDVHL